MFFPRQVCHLTERQRLSAHVLALIIYRLFPNVILLGGDNHSLGFYYDFIFEQPLTENMLELINVEVHRFIKEEPLVRSISMMRENAQTLFEHRRHFFLSELASRQNSNI